MNSGGLFMLDANGCPYQTVHYSLHCSSSLEIELDLRKGGRVVMYVKKMRG